MKSGVSLQKLRKNSSCSRILGNLGVLGLDSHSSSPEPVNFFEAQSSLGAQKQSFGGGAQAVIWGATAPECPPVALGLF